MPEFLVRCNETVMNEYVVTARGPNDAQQKVMDCHDSAVLIDSYPLEIDFRYVEPFVPPTRRGNA